MRGRRNPQSTMLAFVYLDERVPPDHPLRIIKKVADDVLSRISDDFDRMYSSVGRASVPPERLLKSLLLISLYSIRSERAFCQELDYNLLYRWFLDMDLMEPSFDATVFTKNRRRLLRHKMGRILFEEVAYEADRRGLMSDEHFSVDGTLIEAAASIKSFRRRNDEDDTDGPGDGAVHTEDFRGEKLSNKTHESTTDPEARLMGKGKGKKAKLEFMAHTLMYNRHGLVSDFRLTEANGMAERDAALDMLMRIPGSRGLTVGADRGYDSRDFVSECRDLNITPHVAPEEEVVGDRRSYYLPRDLQNEPEGTQACRVDLRLNEDGGRVPSKSVSWGGENRTVWRVGGNCVQLGEDVEADSRGGGQSPVPIVA